MVKSSTRKISNRLTKGSEIPMLNDKPKKGKRVLTETLLNYESDPEDLKLDSDMSDASDIPVELPTKKLPKSTKKTTPLLKKSLPTPPSSDPEKSQSPKKETVVYLKKPLSEKKKLALEKANRKRLYNKLHKEFYEPFKSAKDDGFINETAAPHVTRRHLQMKGEKEPEWLTSFFERLQPINDRISAIEGSLPLQTIKEHPQPRSKPLPAPPKNSSSGYSIAY